MTLRRASGTRALQLRRRALQKRSQPLRSAALLVGGLLMPTHGLVAGVHPGRTHHAPMQSAGKTPAHAVHDVAAREDADRTEHSSRSSARSAASASDQKKARKDQAIGKDHVSAHASGRHARHAEEADAETKPGAKARKGRARHEPQPVDDPQPVHRAGARSIPRGANTAIVSDANHGHRATHADANAAASRKPDGKPAARRNAAAPGAAEAAASAATHIGAGLTVDDFVRGSRRAPTYAEAASAPAPKPAAGIASEAAPMLSSGAAYPQDDERLPLRSSVVTAPASAPHPTAIVRARDAIVAAPTPSPATQIAAALSEPAPVKPPTSEIVEGFGAEVDFRAPPSRPAVAASTPAPRETPAQQERELRDAADVASSPMFVPLYTRDGKLLVPPPLKGSHDILVHQNQMADDAGLTRIQDDDDLARLRRAHLLVDFPESASLHVNENLPENRRSARPWTVKFAGDIAHAFYAHFGDPLQVNSAVRTVAYQLRLQRVNGNAAAVDGEGASPHLTGQALDFGKRGMSMAEIAWMRSYLMPLIDAGKIDVEEEFQQACFHISVYASYVPAAKKHAPAKTEVAQMNRPARSHAIAATADPDDNLR